ncbi:U4/U6.U5 tri-snRNP-associated protein snu66 [Aspergillus udagawae]|uniref:U4/U6.U5 tri-snRNP-associated protein snu66 n=1 Tax=Aspergillus udagawae TaxID=91492 RepID=A0ABQ1B8E1_9EURO|nr:U4/U6.U5 tri-snRNP-associated protein snu66 [Aspergillus udagawae]GFF95979.1 U4/U6.U5 tri-snRNP-associated protein snu66 [Aspergillus udagawae]GFG02884.1 U4/U6.U5 tri-snRNP-associated protein snu66 [Aspergillus udagawae]GFG25552.1 U4/U6.U5 tri-snRNP-associated protein snu66 [Aspergillus udagawae]
MADALSIEQNNKIRVALGLKPLPVPGADATSGPVFKDTRDDSASEEDLGSTLESRQALASENWKKLQEEAEAKRRREAKNAAIKKARDAAQRDRMLEGATLGESGDVDMDTKTWLLQAKKRQKKIEKERALKIARELEERERAAEYSTADLAGLKVGHEVGEFEEGEEHVLTLKDTTIDENEEEGDELEDVNLREKAKVAERLELKKRKPVYDPTEENTGILAQYDEEIEGKKRKRFTLDAQGSTIEEREAKQQEVSDRLKQNLVSLDLGAIETTPVSDYMDVSEIKIKKPKKKKVKTTRQRVIDEDDIFPTTESTQNGAMEVDASNGAPAPAPQKWESSENVSFVDDDDLQASLTRQRRAAFKKRQKVRPEDIARQLREESQMQMEVENEETEEPGLVIDETSEFVSNLQKPTLPERRERRRTTTPAESVKEEPAESIKEESADGDADVDMERSYNDIEDEEDLKERIKREESQLQQISGTGLEEETTLDQGLGATLNMLKQRGLVKPSDAVEHNALHRARERFLHEKTHLETEAEKRARQQRERDRASGKLDRMSAREREEYARWENKQRDQQDARHMAEVFNREYKPDVQLKYVDEFGRLMNQKEAFKHLSHQFHGKGSGRMKTEKRLKKIEEEKKREAMSALDSSQHTGMNNAMGATARKNRQAGVRLG